MAVLGELSYQVRAAARAGGDRGSDVFVVVSGELSYQVRAAVDAGGDRGSDRPTAVSGEQRNQLRHAAAMFSQQEALSVGCGFQRRQRRPSSRTPQRQNLQHRQRHGRLSREACHRRRARRMRQPHQPRTPANTSQRNHGPCTDTANVDSVEGVPDLRSVDPGCWRDFVQRHCGAQPRRPHRLAGRPGTAFGRHNNSV